MKPRDTKPTWTEVKATLTDIFGMPSTLDEFCCDGRTCLIVNQLSSFVVRDELLAIADTD